MRIILVLIFSSFYYCTLLTGQLFWINPNPDDYSDGYQAEVAILNVELRIRSKEVIKKENFSIYVDDKLISGTRMNSVRLRGKTFRSVIPLKTGKQTIKVVYKETAGLIYSEPLIVHFKEKTPNLHILTMGTSPVDLKYTDEDALDFASAFTNQEGLLFSNIYINTLIGNDATATNMNQQIEKLVSTYQVGEISKEDIILLFVSTHGFLDSYSKEFYLQGDDFKPAVRRSTSLSFRAVLSELDRIQCKKLVFIDACHSGGAGAKGQEDISQAIQQIATTKPGITILTSSNSTELSHEDDEWENGAFTEAILKGLQGKADVDNNTIITLNELFYYVRGEVRRLVRGQTGVVQTPQLTQYELGNLPIYVTNSKIPLKSLPHPDKTTKTVNNNKEIADGFTKKETVAMNLQGMIFIEGGTFKRGCSGNPKKCPTDELPSRFITIGDFYMDQHEVTNKEFCSFLNNRKITEKEIKQYLGIHKNTCPIRYYGSIYIAKEGKDNFPVVEVTWEGAKAFCEWRSEKEGGQFRLPTECEWEYTAKEGQYFSAYMYSGNEDLEKVAWFKENASNRLHAVGGKMPNKLRLYDLSGNVSEWCRDWYEPVAYETATILNPLGPKKGQQKVIRGGAWNLGEKSCRTTKRHSHTPTATFSYVGFRCVREY